MVAGPSASHALMELEQIQLSNEVVDSENICKFILDDDRILTVIIHSWWLQESLWLVRVRMLMLVMNSKKEEYE